MGPTIKDEINTFGYPEALYLTWYWNTDHG